MAGGEPRTPPGTPKKAAGGGDKLGPTVDNRHTRNHGGVVTGNNYGYNSIIGTINVTVESATTLTSNVRNFTARVATACERLKSIEDRVGATSAALVNMNQLVEIQARREGITIRKDRKWDVLSEDERNRTESDRNNGEGESKVLKLRCFKDLTEACKGARAVFDYITQKIRTAHIKIHLDLPPGYPTREQLGTKFVLTEDKREELFLAEHDIDKMERNIEACKVEMQLTFTIFDAILKDEKIEIVKNTVLDMYKILRSLAYQDPVKPLNGPLQQGTLHQTLYPLKLVPDKRPLIFPDLSRLTSIYMGWIFSKARPSDSKSGSRSLRPSWKLAVPIRMNFSTEELFLMVLAQMTQRAKLNRTLPDDLAELLRSESRKGLVDNLLRNQNAMLQRNHPQLEWTLAGLEYTSWKKRKLAEETKRIQVILKTQWVPESRPSDSVGRGETWVQFGRGTGGHIRDISGGSMNGIPSTEVRTHRESNTRLPRTRAGPTRPRPFIVVHQSQLMFIKTKGKGKTSGKHEEDSGRRWYLGNDIRGSRIYIERRFPERYPRTPSAPSSHPLPPHPPLNPATFIRFGDTNIPSPPESANVHAVLGEGEEMTLKEEKQIIKDLFAEWEELTDKKGKQKIEIREKSRRRTERYDGDSPDGDSDVGIIRMLMREIEKKSWTREMQRMREMEAEDKSTRQKEQVQIRSERFERVYGVR